PVPQPDAIAFRPDDSPAPAAECACIRQRRTGPRRRVKGHLSRDLSFFGLACAMACDGALYACHGGGCDRKTAQADPEQSPYAPHVARHITAQANGNAVVVSLLHHFV